MLLNLWDSNSIYNVLKHLYGISPDELHRLLDATDDADDIIPTLCRRFNIKLDVVRVDDLLLVGKIVSTTVDNFESLRHYGLLKFTDLLEKDTPISRHLKRYSIQITPSKREFAYKGKVRRIPRQGEDGPEYLVGRSNLTARLDYDHAEIEMFLCEKKEQMLEYSVCAQYPEIFNTIEMIISKNFGDHLSIGDDWAQIAHSHIVSFEIPYDHLTYYTHKIDDYDLHGEFDSYKEFLEHSYFSPEDVPSNFRINIWILRITMDILKYGSCTIYAGIRSDVHIRFEDLNIEEIDA